MKNEEATKINTTRNVTELIESGSAGNTSLNEFESLPDASEALVEGVVLEVKETDEPDDHTSVSSTEAP
jgi:hypothetical protein